MIGIGKPLQIAGRHGTAPLLAVGALVDADKPTKLG